jgi:hypothetical protein
MRIALLLSLMLAAGCRMLDEAKETALHMTATVVLRSVFCLQSANPLPQSSFKRSEVVPFVPRGVTVAKAIPSPARVVPSVAKAVPVASPRAETIIPTSFCVRRAPAGRSIRTLMAEVRIARCKLSAAKHHEEIIIIDRL